MKNTSIALKPYLDAIRSHCEKLTANDLVDFIYSLALAKEPEDRQAFLDQVLNSPEYQSADCEKEETTPDDEKMILDRIENLKASIVERMESIEDGSYWDRSWDSPEEYYDDEDPDYISEEDKSEIGMLLAMTDGCFLRGNFALAETIYEIFAKWFSPRGDEAFSFELRPWDIDTNWRESRARLLRSIYETGSDETKITKFMEMLEIEAQVYANSFGFTDGDYPLLQEVYDSHPTPPEKWDEFLKQIKALLEEEFSNRAQVLYLEICLKLEGIESVKNLVQSRKTPISYLFLLEKFMEMDDWDGVHIFAEEALQNMKNGGHREQVAQILTKAGEALKNDNLILTGKREVFYSDPEEEKLASLITEANKQGVRNQELEQAVKVLKKSHKDEKRLLIMLLFMLGKIQGAYAVLEEKDPVGWSYDSDGIAVFTGGVLAALVNSDQKATTINKFLEEHCDDSYSFSGNGGKILSEILCGLKEVLKTSEEKAEWFSFARKIIESRVDNIVSNKHRKAYDRAARVLGALMEAFVLNGEETVTTEIFDVFRNQKFRQFSAFRRELDEVVKKSSLLNSCCKTK